MPCVTTLSPLAGPSPEEDFRPRDDDDEGEEGEEEGEEEEAVNVHRI